MSETTQRYSIEIQRLETKPGDWDDFPVAVPSEYGEWVKASDIPAIRRAAAAQALREVTAKLNALQKLYADSGHRFATLLLSDTKNAVDAVARGMEGTMGTELPNIGPRFMNDAPAPTT